METTQAFLQEPLKLSPNQDLIRHRQVETSNGYMSRLKGIPTQILADEFKLLVNGDGVDGYMNPQNGDSFGFVTDGFNDGGLDECNIGRGMLSMSILRSIRAKILADPDISLSQIFNLINADVTAAKLDFNNKRQIVNSLGALPNTSDAERRAYLQLNRSGFVQNALAKPVTPSSGVWSSTNVSAAIYKLTKDQQSGNEKVQFVQAGDAGVYAVGRDASGKIHIKELSASVTTQPAIGKSRKTIYQEGEIDLKQIFAGTDIELEFITASTLTLPDSIDATNRRQVPLPPRSGNTQPTTAGAVEKRMRAVASEFSAIYNKVSITNPVEKLSRYWNDKVVTRRAFVVSGALLGAGGFLAGLERLDQKIANWTKGWFKFIKPEVQVDNKREITKEFEKMPNRELILEQSKIFMKEQPGGYSLPLDQREPLEDISAESNKSHVRNLQGIDERSKKEMVLMAVLKSTVDPGYRQKLQNEKPELALNIDVALQTDNWASKARGKATVGDLMLAMQACGSISANTLGMEMLYDMCQSGELESIGMKPLSQEKITWAERNLIDPKSLIWAEYTRPYVIEILREAPELFFDALPENERAERIKNLEQTVSNPGIIAALNQQETGNMRNEGDVPPEPQLNLDPGQYPTGPDDLRVIGEKLEALTGLPYTMEFEISAGVKRKAYQYIHSSGRFGFGSGGAIFGQFMPINMVHFLDKLEKVQEKFRAKGIELPPVMPGSPFWMPILQSLYINGEWHPYQGQPNGDKVLLTGVKGGYVAGQPESMKFAVESWNAYEPEVKYILDTGIDYSKTFSNVEEPEDEEKKQRSRFFRRARK